MLSPSVFRQRLPVICVAFAACAPRGTPATASIACADSVASLGHLIRLPPVARMFASREDTLALGARAQHALWHRGTRNLVVASLSWSGPPQGALFLLDCDG